MGQVIKSLSSFLLSVCLSALLRSQFLFDLMKFCAEVGGPKSKKGFVRGSKSDDPLHILLQFFTPVMHFQWEGPNTAVTRPVDRLWRLKTSNDVPRERLQAQSSNFAPKTKMGINAFSMGIYLPKYLTHNISTTMRDRAIVLKDHI